MEQREFRRQQIIGVLTGLIAGVAAENYWPELRAALGWYGPILWGGAIGGLIASISRLPIIGQRVTGSGNSTLNVVVGTTLLAATVFVLFTVAGLILR